MLAQCATAQRGTKIKQSKLHPIVEQVRKYKRKPLYLAGTTGKKMHVSLHSNPDELQVPKVLGLG